jgi:hypothetical protein
LDEKINSLIDKKVPPAIIARYLDLDVGDLKTIVGIKNYYKEVEKKEGEQGLKKIAEQKIEVQKLLDKEIPMKFIHLILGINKKTVDILIEEIKFYKNEKIEGE